MYACIGDIDEAILRQLKSDKTAVLFLDTYNTHGMAEQRALIAKLMNADCQTPVVIGRAYGNLEPSTFQLQSATDMGALLLDGMGTRFSCC